MLSLWLLNGSTLCWLVGICFLLYGCFGHLHPSSGCCHPQAMWKNNFLCITEVRRNMAPGNTELTETRRASSSGDWGELNALWFLHKRSALTNGSRGWIHDEYYSTEWFQLVEWVFLPVCVTEPNFYKNTDTHGGLHWQKCKLLLHCGKSIIQRRKRNKLYQKLARDKMKGGVFSAVINKLDLNTTSLWSQY